MDTLAARRFRHHGHPPTVNIHLPPQRPHRSIQSRPRGGDKGGAQQGAGGGDPEHLGPSRWRAPVLGRPLVTSPFFGAGLLLIPNRDGSESALGVRIGVDVSAAGCAGSPSSFLGVCRFPFVVDLWTVSLFFSCDFLIYIFLTHTLGKRFTPCTYEVVDNGRVSLSEVDVSTHVSI